MPEGYTFAADTCVKHNGKLYVEVMHAGTGKGEIFAYDNGTWHPVDLPVEGGHPSSPQIMEHEGKTNLFPEMADTGAPSLFELGEDPLTSVAVQQFIGLKTSASNSGLLITQWPVVNACQFTGVFGSAKRTHERAHYACSRSNVSGGPRWLDYYAEKTTPMAGIRRIKGLMK